MAEEVKVSASVDVNGLEQAMAKFERFSGSASSVQRAMGQFGRMGEEALRSGGALSPEQYDRMGQALNNIKRIEADITKTVADRKNATDAMMKQFPQMAKYIDAISRGGGTPLDAIKALGAQSEAALKNITGMTPAEFQRLSGLLTPTKDEEKADKLREVIPVMERTFGQVGRMGDELPRNLDRTFMRFTSQFGRVLAMGLGAAGVGSALGILSQSRSRWLEFHLSTMESGFMGGGAAGVRNLETAAFGAAGLASGMPNEAAQTGIALRRAGARSLSADQIRQFSRLGLFYGMGRDGFANMAGEMGNSVFGSGDIGSMRRFGMLGAGMAESAGLTPSQRLYMLESNRNLMEQTVRLYGARPINVDDWYKGVNSLMVAFKPLNLAGGPMPLIAETMRSLMPVFSPMGKSPTDNLRMAIMMGFSPDEMLGTGKGLFGGAAQLMNNIGAGPGGVFSGMRRFLTGPLMQGADLGTGEGVDRAMLMSNVLSPQLRDAITRLSVIPGALEAFTRAKDVGDLPPDAAKELKAMEDQMRETQGGAWKITDVDFAKREIEKIGGKVAQLEQTLKELLGPEGALIASVVASGLIGATGTGLAIAGLGTLAASAWYGRKDIYEIVKKRQSGQPLTEKDEKTLDFTNALGGTDPVLGTPDFDVRKVLRMSGTAETNEAGNYEILGQWQGSLLDVMGQGLGYGSPILAELSKIRENLEEIKKARDWRMETYKGNATSNKPRGPTR